jgi:hypothetical protein
LIKIGITSDVTDLKYLISQRHMMWVIGGKFTIDIFFFMSAFFGTLKFMKVMDEQNGFSLKLWLVSVLKRAYRLWIIYVIVLILFWQVFPIFFKGPFITLVSPWINSCNNG